MLMICNTWYCFLRLHQILCERLTRMYECAQKLVAEETQNKSERKESTAIALRLKPKSEFSSLIHCLHINAQNGSLPFKQFPFAKVCKTDLSRLQ
jgi:C-terminal domain of Sin3a protein